MSNQDDLMEKSEILAAILAEQIQKPHNIPIPMYIQEAESLYVWVQEDKDPLTDAGLDWELVEDLPLRFGALKAAEANWNSDRISRPDAAALWAKEYPGAYKLKRQLLHAFRFAFRNRPDLLEALRNTTERKRRSHAAMMQDLVNLEVLGTANADLLEPIGFDVTLLDKASDLADDMRIKFAESTSARNRTPETKNIRDRAYTHVKEAVDEICKYGRFVFKENKERLHGYRSHYLRGLNLSRWRQSKKKRNAAVPGIPLPTPPTT